MWSRTLLFCGRARADIRDVLAHTHFTKKHWSLENIIAGRAAAVTPAPLNIRSRVLGAYLLAVAINTAVRGINMRAPLEHS